MGTFLLFKNLFMIDQYVFGDLLGLSNIELNLAGCLYFASTINFLYSLLDEETSPYYYLLDWHNISR